MKKFAIAALLSVFTFVDVPAIAAGAKGNAGINFSTAGVYGLQGELDISSRTNNAPFSAQAFWKSFSQDYGPNAYWSTTGIGVAAIYDFSSAVKLDKDVHPYAGLGLILVNYDWRGTGTPGTYGGVNSGLYVTVGVRYPLAPHIDADLNFNNFGDLTLGANYNF